MESEGSSALTEVMCFSTSSACVHFKSAESLRAEVCLWGFSTPLPLFKSLTLTQQHESFD